jgi:hypothetical protein
MAMDIMPPTAGQRSKLTGALLPSLQDLAAQLYADKQSGHPGAAWLKYMNWEPDRNNGGPCYHDVWTPDHHRSDSGDRGHIHCSARTDFYLSGTADSYDLVARTMGDTDMFLPTNGSTGEEVKFWQQTLNELGFTPGEIDGDYGAKTQAAVAAFRKSLGVTTNYSNLTGWTAFAIIRALAVKYAGKDGQNGAPGTPGKDGQNGTLTGTLSVTGGSLNVEAV